MSTGQPSNAPQNAAPDQSDDLTAAAVLNDDRMDAPAGGGGLGGASAADPLAGSERGSGMAPATEDADEANLARPEREAQRQAIETTPSTRGRSSGS